MCGTTFASPWVSHPANISWLRETTEDPGMKSLFESHVNLVGKVMNLQLERQNVVASNIANIKTRGYKPRKLEFEEQLQDALGLNDTMKVRRTNEKHLPNRFDPATFIGEASEAFKPRIVHGEDRVDVDKEMALMAKTNLAYTTLATIMKSNFDGLRTTIQEGSR